MLGASVLALGLGGSASFDRPLSRPPLDPPITVTGGFGEYRIGHFHAGLDLGTGGRVGRPVYAPRSGWIERVRASGVGYGRSLYLRTDDGRLLQLGHLDAFVEPVASWVAAIQDSSGQYEQDLWPEAHRFAFRAGERIAWTGESGAGGPHLHFEIRRGDMAYHPLRAGLKVSDTRAPSLLSLTLEPLDDTSFVERGAAPYTIALGARPETVRVWGRVRAVVGARDGVWGGVDRMVPWSVAMEWAGERVECRFDSVSWATDMPEGDFVYDAGRVVGDKGLVLWAPAGFRPRVIRAAVPLAEEAGTIRVAAGDVPRTLRLVARDVAGNRSERRVTLRAPSEGAHGPDTTRALSLAHPRVADDRFEWASLPSGFLRVTYRGAGAGVRAVSIGFPERGIANAASPGRGGWTAILRVDQETSGRLAAWGRTAEGRIARDRGPEVLVTRGSSDRGSAAGPFTWEIPPSARFDSGPVVWRGTEGGEKLEAPPAERELIHGRTLGYLGPESEPLRTAVKLSARVGGSPRAGIYRFGDGWEWVGSQRVGSRYQDESRRLGWFAEFEDTVAPRVEPAITRAGARTPYSRWALEAVVAERGSGLDARASYFTVDDHRVATEWDPDAGVLRWRPLRPPGRGTHRFEVVASDRAGNVGRRSGSFVLD